MYLKRITIVICMYCKIYWYITYTLRSAIIYIPFIMFLITIFLVVTSHGQGKEKVYSILF